MRVGFIKCSLVCVCVAKWFCWCSFYLSLAALANFYDRSVSYNSHISIHCYRRIKNFTILFHIFFLCALKPITLMKNIWNIDFILLKNFSFASSFATILLNVVRWSFLRRIILIWAYDIYGLLCVTNKIKHSNRVKWNRETINCQRNTFWMQMKKKKKTSKTDLLEMRRRNVVVAVGNGMLLLFLENDELGRLITPIQCQMKFTQMQ